MKKSQPFQTHAQRIATLRSDAAAMRAHAPKIMPSDLAGNSLSLLKKQMEDSIKSIERMQYTMRMMSRRANQILDIALRVTGLEEYIGIWSVDLMIEPYQMLMFSDRGDLSMRFRLNMNGKKYNGDIKKCPLFKVMNFYMPMRWLDMSAPKIRKEMQKLLLA